MMCGTDSKTKAKEYTWRGFSRHDRAALENIQNSIRSGVLDKIKNGTSNPHFVKGGPQTTVKVVDYTELVAMPPQEVQQMFKTRDFIIWNTPTEEEQQWGHMALKAITQDDWTKTKRQIQSKS
jgi:hypothetical protein